MFYLWRLGAFFGVILHLLIMATLIWIVLVVLVSERGLVVVGLRRLVVDIIIVWLELSGVVNYLNLGLR